MSPRLSLSGSATACEYYRFIVLTLLTVINKE